MRAPATTEDTLSIRYLSSWMPPSAKYSFASLYSAAHRPPAAATMGSSKK
eukprot:CAMPEP_0182806710 /NCGR_PEP_ID=MMETSP0006_2-20121128/5744_1 /TAXON_ID=97485 /ORGANISM="Prymnesium parvum, Strain Texoma1" /LENGTH=49 /DNA_ID=CAMNT_0024932343 /DNA_START=867 /DNA_END=1016 /DNA_ORIENTATION=+